MQTGSCTARQGHHGCLLQDPTGRCGCARKRGSSPAQLQVRRFLQNINLFHTVLNFSTEICHNKRLLGNTELPDSPLDPMNCLMNCLYSVTRNIKAEHVNKGAGSVTASNVDFEEKRLWSTWRTWTHRYWRAFTDWETWGNSSLLKTSATSRTRFCVQGWVKW